MVKRNYWEDKFEKFNNNLQGTVSDTPNTDFNPYQDSYFGHHE